MQIRKAEERDFEKLKDLLFQVADVHHTLRPDIFMPAARKYSDAQLRGILANERTPVFVVQDDCVVAYAFCAFRSYPDNGLFHDLTYLYIDDLCVDEAHRGKHIGTKLYAHLREFAKEQGCDGILLNVWADNKSAERFYESLGMRRQRIIMEDKL